MENYESSTHCKCCLNESDLSDLWLGHVSADTGEIEVYGEMLIECFGLPWVRPDNGAEEQICLECIEKLRIAYNLKKEILEINEMVNHDLVEKPSRPIRAVAAAAAAASKFKTVRASKAVSETSSQADATEDDQTLRTERKIEINKEEPPSSDEEGEYLQRDDCSSQTGDEEWTMPTSKNKGSNNYEDIEFLEDSDEFIETNSVLTDDETSNPEPKAKRHKKKNKQYTELELEEAIKAVQNCTMTLKDSSHYYEVPYNTLKRKFNNSYTPRSGQVTGILQGRRKRDNLMKILRNCNATPIRGYWGIGFRCSYCTNQYKLARELKKHTLKYHRPVSKQPLELSNKAPTEIILKLDITALRCNLCKLSMDTVTELIDHLNEHNLKIDPSIQDIILPFKFTNDYLKCVVCGESFNSFIMLVKHMSVHYANYKCKVCGRVFTNTKSFFIHEKYHETGVYTCNICGNVLPSQVRLSYHIRRVHINQYKVLICGYCGEKFITAGQKINHEASEHGVEKPLFQCEECSQSFDNAVRDTSRHRRKIHLKCVKENCACKECGKSFYSVTSLKAHRNWHTGEEPYNCMICGKSFTSRSGLRKHLITHASEFKYKCDYCNMKFVQRVCLKLHVTTKHRDKIT